MSRRAGLGQSEPESIRPRWESWGNDLLFMEQGCVARCVKPQNFGKVSSVELFSDASNTGYGQCSYLRLTDDRQQVHCSFMMGKARVTPMKHVTIPRLELTAALLSAKISAFLKRELESENLD